MSKFPKSYATITLLFLEFLLSAYTGSNQNQVPVDQAIPSESNNPADSIAAEAPSRDQAELTLMTELAMEILKLEDMNYPLSSEQAQTLLPL